MTEALENLSHVDCKVSCVCKSINLCIPIFLFLATRYVAILLNVLVSLLKLGSKPNSLFATCTVCRYRAARWVMP